MSLIKLLRTYLGQYRRAVVLIIVLQAAQTTATLLLPTINSRLIDEGVLPGDNGAIWRHGATMLAISVTQVALAVGAMWYAAQTAMAFGRDLRRDLFRQVTELSAREVGHFGAGSLITRITNDIQQIQTLTAMMATMLIAAPITMIVGIVLAMREDIGLSPILAITIPIEVIVLGLIVAKMRAAFEQIQIWVDRVNTVLREQIVGIRVVRAFTREPEEGQRFGVANAGLTETSMRASRLMAATFPTVNLIVSLSTVALLWIGGDRVADGKTQVGSLIAYIAYLTQVLMAVMMATFMVSMIPRAAVSAGRLVEVFDTTSSVKPPINPIGALLEPGTVEFRDVSFRYPGAEHAVLDSVSTRVTAGETLAIIGSTGAGKTTLLTLAARLIDTSDGAVLVGGVDVRQLEPSVLWGSIGYVPQRSFLFAGTVASNLRFARPNATDEELWEALEVAQADGFVQSMSSGLNSQIDQGGSNVSGGQRQRLAIARALIARPAIYLFDDSFSALDLATEARLRTALRPYTRQAAVLLVTQRVSTIDHADRILVLEDGEAVGQGTHDELLSTCQTYAEIVASQRAAQAAA